MRKIVFTSTARERIARLNSPHFTSEETMAFQIKLTQAIQNRLLHIRANEGYREYAKGPWAKTRRVIVKGCRVYYELNDEKDSIIVKAIKPSGTK